MHNYFIRFDCRISQRFITLDSIHNILERLEPALRLIKNLCIFSLLFSEFVSAEIIKNNHLLITEETFTQNAKLEMKDLGFVDSDINKIEHGVLNGVSYKFYYADGSGIFSGVLNGALNSDDGNDWDVGCSKDPISDEKMCHMVKRNLWIFVTGNKLPFVMVGSNDFPGSSAVIRIDGGVPFKSRDDSQGNFSNKVSLKIIEKLKAGKTITTRHKKWPNDYTVDDTWEIYGFNEAFSYINWAVKRIK